jgi:hypothetical protein
MNLSITVKYRRPCFNRTWNRFSKRTALLKCQTKPLIKRLKMIHWNIQDLSIKLYHSIRPQISPQTTHLFIPHQSVPCKVALLTRHSTMAHLQCQRHHFTARHGIYGKNLPPPFYTGDNVVDWRIRAFYMSWNLIVPPRALLDGYRTFTSVFNGQQFEGLPLIVICNSSIDTKTRKEIFMCLLLQTGRITFPPQ